MAARRPFWKWQRWKSIGFCLWPPSTCIWNLKLKFQSKLDLCSGNHVVYRQTDRRTDKVNPVYPPSNFVGRGYNKVNPVYPPSNFVGRGYKKKTFFFSPNQYSTWRVNISCLPHSWHWRVQCRAAPVSSPWSCWWRPVHSGSRPAGSWYHYRCTTAPGERMTNACVKIKPCASEFLFYHPSDPYTIYKHLSMAKCKTAVMPVHQQWSYCSRMLSHNEWPCFLCVIFFLIW